MRLNIRTKLFLGFGAVIAILLIISVVAFVGVRSLAGNQESVTHTQEVILELQTVLTALVDAETGQRGFLITGEEYYMGPFASGTEQIYESIDHVAQLTVDNPRQQENLPTLTRLVHDKLMELNETIQLRRNDGFDAAQAVVLTDVGIQTADEIRAVIGEMIAEEERLLTNRTNSTISSSRLVNIVIIGGFAVAVVMATVIAVPLSNSIAGGSARVSAALQTITRGDLSANVEIKSNDELGQMAVAYGEMQSYLAELAQAAGRIADGEFAVELHAKSERDVLGSAFAKMAKRLQESIGSLEQRIADRTQVLSRTNEKLEAENMERRRAEDALQESESRLCGLVESAPMAIVAIDGDGRITLASAKTEELFGYPRDDLIGQPVEVLLPERFREGHVGHRAAYLSDPHAGPMGCGFDLFGRRKNGTAFPIEIGLSSVNMTDGALSIAFIADITDRKRMEERLRNQARNDSLTGTLNHAAILDELRITIAAADDDAPCAVAMVDVDGLKATNDTHGHQVGDAVIIKVAGALSRRGAVVGRYGGDEFLAVLPSAGRDEAEQYCSEVAAALADACVTEPETGASVSVVASIGLAIYPEDGLTIDDIVDLSDSAMYASRRQRSVGTGGLSPSRTLGGERAAAMVGQIVPLLTASGTIENKLRLVAHRLSVGAGYDAVNVDVFAQASGLPTARSTFSRVPDEVVAAWQAERRRMEDEPILQHVKSTRRALIVEDPQHEERLTEAQRAVMRAAELQSAVVVPLFWEVDMIGVLSVASKRKDAFTAGDIEFLTTIATQITSVVRMATLFDELQTTSGHLAQAREEAVLLLAAAAEAHDTTTGQHLRGVRGLTEALARGLSYDEESARELGMAAVLHDIGKIRVQDSILANTGPLAGDELESMQKHTVWGAEFLEHHAGFELAATVARSHHERWDGGGYPDGLAGEAIPTAATIVAVADAFDAITSDRPYRAARSVDDALREIEAGSGTQFSPNAVEVLVRVHRQRKLPLPAMDTADESAAGQQAA